MTERILDNILRNVVLGAREKGIRSPEIKRGLEQEIRLKRVICHRMMRTKIGRKQEKRGVLKEFSISRYGGTYDPEGAVAVGAVELVTLHVV